MPRFRLLLSTVMLTLGSSVLGAEAAYLTSGPMVGHTTAQESRIWVQTQDDSQIQIRYWPTAFPKNIKSSPVIEASEKSFYTATVPLSSLLPNTRYQYEVWMGGKKISPEHPQTFKTASGNGDLNQLNVMLGSCFFVNDGIMNALQFGYSGGFEIFKAMEKQPADMMFWMGDNSYYNPYDFSSIWSMNRRVREHRSSPHIQGLLARLPHYSTWDDHDFGPNNSDRHFKMKSESFKLFKTYWPNPRHGLLATPGVFYKVSRKDSEFFVTDNRYYRDPDHDPNPKKSFLGPNQINWLKSSLKASRATFKVIVVGNPVLNRYYGESYSRFQYELQGLLNWLNKEKIEGVIFLSGDRHHSDLLKMDRKGAYPLYNFTVSPLTSLPTQVMNKGEDTDSWRVPGSLLKERNYGIFQVSGPSGQREIKLKLFDTKGKLKWEHKIPQSELSYTAK